jgi:mono/diheme cytochrome c family protein
MKLFLFKKTLLSVSIIFFLLCFAQCNSRVEFSDEVEAGLPEKIDFNYHIKPILSDNCFACHGPDENKIEANLRLDLKESALAALGEHKDHYAIVPGNTKKSAVYNRITSTDPEIMMPPPESNLKLSEQEVALITRWIEQGAAYKPHWAFIKPEKTAVPQVENTAWVNNDIDHFTLAKLEEKGFKPSEKASKETLIRRVSFDLTGLPPTVEEVDDFLKDNAPDAYENLVNRLLKSPHYGERMASEWLDVARYADSHGYQDDGMRNMWPWRDWVIQFFNENMPYDDFILWQIAGDMLPNTTKEQKLATGFNRNHLQSQEGGIVDEEYRVEYVADRTATLGKGFLALSTECARCHDHKYDPISQQEYFELYAFFNNVNDTGQSPYMGEASPTVIITDEKVDKLLSYVKEKMQEQEQKTDRDREEYRKGFDQWLTKVKGNPQQPVKLEDRIGHYPLDKLVDDKYINLVNKDKPADMVVSQNNKDLKIAEGKFGKAVKLVGDSYVDLGKEIGYFERNEPFTISIWLRTLKDSLHGAVFSKSGGFANGYRGYDLMLREDGRLSASLNHTWPANAIEVHTTDKIPVDEWVHLVMTYDGSSKAKGLGIYLNGKPMEFDIFTDHLKRSILTYGKDKETWGNPRNLRIGSRDNETLSDALVDEFSVFDRRLSAVEISGLYGTADPIMVYLKEEDHQALLDYYLLNVSSAYQQHFKTLTNLRGEENEILSAQPEVMVMGDRKEPRSTFILDRGAYDAPTKQVYPSTPEAVLEFPEELPKNRLGLAKWLIHEENPLTARVAVNRYWQMIFGRGIVKTSDDFGNQGDLPSHPELLDWLAVKFRESGWHVKELLKLMVTSATYQQSSVLNKELKEKDPANVWLARGPSYRMPAEMIRDNALAASGLLVEKIGGRSVKPYQPDGLWEELAIRNATVYEPDSGSNLYRRGLYTIWKRSSPPPSMVIFDASDKYLCTVKRQNTNTPLQALVLLNDPQYLEAARMLAERMIKEGGDQLDEQITYGFRLMTSRKPDEPEMQILQNLYEAELDEFRSSPAAADSLLQVGEQPRDQSLPENQVAALTVVVSTLINYDQAVYKR